MAASLHRHLCCKAPAPRVGDVVPCRALRCARSVQVLAMSGHGHGSASQAVLTEKDRGFIAEMRKVAMKLHTKEQAPREGGKETPKAQKAWQPSREGYLTFLAESKVVYDSLEQAVLDNSHPEYASLRNTGLERASALEKDLQWFQQEYGIPPPVLSADGPGHTYARLCLELAQKDPQAFVCHFYNFYFAHTAGGRMIGNKVAQMILDNKQLQFYEWEGDVQQHLEKVRKAINDMAENWTEEQKKRCLEETEASFKYSGVILQCITQ